MKNKFVITKDKLQTLTKGSCFMASGGGGSFVMTKYMIEKEFDDNAKVVCINPLDVKKNDWFYGAACMFPPSAMTKDKDMVSPLINVLSSMETWFKNASNYKKEYEDFKSFDLFHPLEVGASNSALPIIALSKINKKEKRDIKIIDADTAGRSIPTLPLIIFANYIKNRGVSWFPNFVASKTLADKSFNTGQFRFDNGTSLEEAFITLIMNQFEQCGGFSVFPMNGKVFKKNPSVFGTLTDSLEVGKIIENTKLTQKKKANEIVEYFNGVSRKSKIIFEGDIKKIILQQGGTDKEAIIIEGKKDFKGDILELRVSNENIFAYRYKKGSNKKSIYILGPDSISFLPYDKKLEVLDNSDLFNYYNCPNVESIGLYVIGISAAKIIQNIVQEEKDSILLNNWKKEWKNLGYDGEEYIQPWLEY